jgi:hypothetical protein
MGFVVADGDKNLVLYMYQPESRESFGGRIISCNILLHNVCALIFIMRLIKYKSLYLMHKYVFLTCERYKSRILAPKASQVKSRYQNCGEQACGGRGGSSSSVSMGPSALAPDALQPQPFLDQVHRRWNTRVRVGSGHTPTTSRHRLLLF